MLGSCAKYVVVYKRFEKGLRMGLSRFSIFFWWLAVVGCPCWLGKGCATSKVVKIRCVSKIFQVASSLIFLIPPGPEVIQKDRNDVCSKDSQHSLHNMVRTLKQLNKITLREPLRNEILGYGVGQQKSTARWVLCGFEGYSGYTGWCSLNRDTQGIQKGPVRGISLKLQEEDEDQMGFRFLLSCGGGGNWRSFCSWSFWVWLLKSMALGCVSVQERERRMEFVPDRSEAKQKDILFF